MRNTLWLLLLLCSFSAFSQCDIQNKISPDGTMYYFMEFQSFYFTDAKALKGGIYTDKENYYLALQPSPFPEKSKGIKMKEDLEITLANNKSYTLQHFDTQYVDDNSTLQLLYSIDEKQLKDLLGFEITQVKIDMKGSEGVRTYLLKLHKKALQEQLNCFLHPDKEKK